MTNTKQPQLLQSIVEQEAFGIGMNSYREELSEIAKLPLDQIFAKLTEGFTLEESNGEMRPVWMCYKEKKYTALERAYLFSRILHNHSSVLMTVEFEDASRFYCTAYCSRDDYPDTEFSVMAESNVMAAYVNSAIALAAQQCDKKPVSVYLSNLPEVMSVISESLFLHDVYGSIKFASNA